MGHYNLAIQIGISMSDVLDVSTLKRHFLQSLIVLDTSRPPPPGINETSVDAPHWDKSPTAVSF